MNPHGRSDCAGCGAGLFDHREKGIPFEGALPEQMPRPKNIDRSERAFVPVEYEAVEDPGRKKLLEPDDEIKVDRADMVEKETYQCLICGSTVPALADRCPICGTIFVNETEAKNFTGIPVARIPKQGELEAAEMGNREVPTAHEVLNIELPLPRPLSARAVMEADVLPVLEPGEHSRVIIKKKVLKKLVKKG
jgi:hypothetical protein